MLSEAELGEVQIEPQTNPKIQSATLYLLINHQYLINHHYYTRFMADETELWCFGCGLGEQAIVDGLGEAFLRYCEAEDPRLGRIVLSIGVNATSFFPYKGDLNLWWAFGDHKRIVEDHFERTTVKPDLLLCPSRIIQEIVKSHGLPSLYLPFGASDRFKPLNLQRKGLGYAGNPLKPTEQYAILLDPFKDRADFEWSSKHRDDPYLTLEQLNEFYNRKQIVFGMIGGHCQNLHLIPNRMYETLASGTPFITGRYDLEDTFSFKYPYMTDSREETVGLVDEVLADYPRHLAVFAEYSRNVREKHSLDVRLKTLMEHLKQWR